MSELQVGDIVKLNASWFDLCPEDWPSVNAISVIKELDYITGEEERYLISPGIQLHNSEGKPYSYLSIGFKGKYLERVLDIKDTFILKCPKYNE